MDGQPPLLPADALSQSREYLESLALAPVIFKKKGDLKRISHGHVQAYYKYLLQADDLSKLTALTDIEVLALGTDGAPR